MNANDVVEKLSHWIKAMGHSPAQMKSINRANPDNEIPALLYDAITVIRELQDEIRELHLK